MLAAEDASIPAAASAAATKLRQEIRTVSERVQSLLGQLKEEDEKLQKLIQQLPSSVAESSCSRDGKTTSVASTGKQINNLLDVLSSSSTSEQGGRASDRAHAPQAWLRGPTGAQGEAPGEEMERSACAPFSKAVERATLLGVPSLLKLKRFDTPTISNGLEMITKDRNYGWKGFNLERVIDHMPDWGTMVGYAVTVTIQPSNRRRVNANLQNRQAFADYVAGLPRDLPKIIVVQDLDVQASLAEHGRPFVYGSMWGEVNGNFFSKMGARGCVTDGAVRDLPELKAAGFRALSRTLSPSHGFGGVPLDWDLPVEVFGAEVRPGQLLAADRHGFQVVPEDLEGEVLRAAEDGDAWERDHTIAASFAGEGATFAEVNERMGEARGKFGDAKNAKYGTFAARMGGDHWAEGS